MKRNDYLIKMTVLIAYFSLSQVLSAQINKGMSSIGEEPSDSLIKEDTKINMVFKETSKQLSTGSINYIDPESELLRDTRTDLGSAINGKVPGVFDSYNLWGIGNAVIVVDGIRQASITMKD